MGQALSAADETLQRALGDAEGQQLVAKILERKALADGSVELTLQAGPELAEQLRMHGGASIVIDAERLSVAMDEAMQAPLFASVADRAEQRDRALETALEAGALGNHLLSQAVVELFAELNYDGVAEVARQALEQQPLPNLLDAVVRNRVKAENERVEAASLQAMELGCGVIVRRSLEGRLLSAEPDMRVPYRQVYIFNGTPEELVQQALEKYKDGAIPLDVAERWNLPGR